MPTERKVDRKYSIEEVLEHTLMETPFKAKRKELSKDFDGDSIRMNSHRYRCFKEHGVVCIGCGVEGEYFLKERQGHKDIRKNKGKPWHFNLFAIKEGEEVLMTKDHVMPKSKGGKDEVDNYQPMCQPCNTEKGDK